MRALHKAAEKYLGIGLCALPAILSEKRPLVNWREYQKLRPTPEQLAEWFRQFSPTAVCLVGGEISGNLEVIDFDLKAEFFERWRELVESAAPGLVARLLIERSQSGGKHVAYQCREGVGESAKLAQRAVERPNNEPYIYAGKPHDSRPKGDKWIAKLTFIETKAEGGVFLCHPSPGYELEQGSFDDIPVVTARERDIMISAAKTLNEVIREIIDYTPSGPVGDRPGDDFNRRGDIRPYLRKHGWTEVLYFGREYWRRPGKDWGWSAEIRHGRFCVYSSNAAPFEEETIYGIFRVYALLEHNSDFPAAAKALAEQGYGGPPTLPKIAPANDGNSASSVEIPAPTHIRDSKSNRWILHPGQTIPTANAYIEEFHSHPDGRTLHHFADTTLEWRDGCYRELEEGAINNRMQNWLHGCLRLNKDGELLPFNSNPNTVKAAISTLKGQVHIPATTLLPSWLDVTPMGIEPRDIVACKSRLLHLPSMAILPATPNFFTTSALDFDYDPDAAYPERWMKFLHQLFDGDSEQLDLLQEWFGYCLTGDTSLQKMLLIVGPKRGGKGTIARVLSKLVGMANVCGPTVSSLAGQFGLQPLVGKSLAVVSDARFHGDNISTVIERLLCISGEDLVTIDRKHLGGLHMKLPTRFMFMTNEFPRFSDSSAALAGRFMILQLRQSFYGKEDPKLTESLFEELPGILRWAIFGWHSLRERGHFHMPLASREAVQEIEELSSPVSTFVRDRCTVGIDLRIPVNDLWGNWRSWCEEEGRNAVGTKSIFRRDLVAAFPSISRRRNADQSSFYDGIALRGL